MLNHIIKNMAKICLAVALPILPVLLILPCSLAAQQMPSQKTALYPKIKKEMQEWINKHESHLRDFSKLIENEPKIFILITQNKKERQEKGFWQVINDVNVGKVANKEDHVDTLEQALASYSFSAATFVKIEDYFNALGLDGIIAGITLGHKAIVFIRQSVTDTGEGFCPMYVFDLKKFDPADYPGIEKLEGNWFLAPPEALSFD